MKVAILGCGYVADMYLATRQAHAVLDFHAAFDRQPDRLAAFTKFHQLKAYASFDELLADAQIELVLNLTNPRSHYETTKACLKAGKHVYSEKPLAMQLDHAQELASLAKEKGLSLSAAPCSLLSETAQTLWKGVHEKVMGPIRLVYAAFDDGMVHRFNPTRWTSASGAHWPAQDEFEVGCTFEHAGYVLTWLAAWFGPARRVHAYSTTCIPDKGLPVGSMAPDFTVGVIEYDNNIVARVTCSIVAPIDKSISIIGDNGTLYTKYVRNDGAPVYFSKTPYNKVSHAIGTRLENFRIKLEHFLRLPFSLSGLRYEKKYPYARRPVFRRSGGTKLADFLRGPAEQVEAIRDKRPCRLSAELGVHIVELIETLQYPDRFPRPCTLTTTFEPIAPLSWK
ncbi:MAG: Gfo/Idh/MocA family oxidoreductase [Gemmatales bacterium]